MVISRSISLKIIMGFYKMVGSVWKIKNYWIIPYKFFETNKISEYKRVSDCDSYMIVQKLTLFLSLFTN